MNKERPILFNGAMVNAILARDKSQTRRVVKLQPDSDSEVMEMAMAPGSGPSWNKWAFRFDGKIKQVKCPYGKIGDRLWVRENFRLRLDQDHKPPSEDWWKSGCWYEADHENLQPSGCGGGCGKQRPSIHMPRWASRILLEITDIRVEHVQNISEYDCREEGIELKACPVCGYTSKDASIQMDHGLCKGPGFPEDREVYKESWNSINEKRDYGWDTNCWVWVVEFKVITP